MLRHQQKHGISWLLLPFILLMVTLNNLRINSKNISKGTFTINEYMQQIKRVVDEHVLLGNPMEHEDIIDKVLNGLDSEYQLVIDVVNNHETIISFEELHEKLINKELSLSYLPCHCPCNSHSVYFSIPFPKPTSCYLPTSLY